MAPNQFAQSFCTVADLIADMNAPGIDEAGLLQRIREASDYLQKEIGWFIPVTMTRKFHGHGREHLLVPPLLSVASIVNADITLLTTDYILHPDGRFWSNGPYGEILPDPDSSVHLSTWEDEEDGVEITGQWGLYDRSLATGATVQDAPQSAVQTSMQVTNGAQLSLGAVLLIESEQELVSGWATPIDSTANLDGAITASDDVLKLTDATQVHIGEVVRIDLEQLKILDIHTTTKEASVVRGWNKTHAAAHLTSSDVYVYRTATVERGMNGTTAASHLQGTAISRYVVPDDVDGGFPFRVAES